MERYPTSKKLLMENIKYKVGLGEKILFWKDRWVDDRTLGAQLLDMFKCVVDKEGTVNSYMTSWWSTGLEPHLKEEFEGARKRSTNFTTQPSKRAAHSG